MANTGAPWSLPSPELPESPHGPAQLGDLAGSVAAALGRAYPCTSITRPSPVAGMLIYETDTQILSVSHDGVGWAPIWHPVTWTVPASPYSNGWIAYATGYGGLAYYKDPQGFVHLSGLIKSGTISTAIFTLPAGYRPAAPELFLQSAANGAARVDVATNGAISVYGYFAGGTNGFVGLYGITFHAP